MHHPQFVLCQTAAQLRLFAVASEDRFDAAFSVLPIFLVTSVTSCLVNDFRGIQGGLHHGYDDTMHSLLWQNVQETVDQSLTQSSPLLSEGQCHAATERVNAIYELL